MTREVGRVIGESLSSGVVALFGELGAGKTCLAQGIALGLGVKGYVTSPTYTIVQEYQGRVPFYHMDAYRVLPPHGEERLQWEEYFYSEGITAVEWADRVEKILPEERLEVRMSLVGSESRDSNRRKIQVTARGEGFSPVIEELKRVCWCSE